MKAILVIDMPKGYGKITDNKATVNLKNWKLNTSFIVCNVPLKPMPEKYTDMLSYDSDTFERGWNDCIDEILGEEE